MLLEKSCWEGVWERWVRSPGTGVGGRRRKARSEAEVYV